jgi:hypothetical protein
MLRYSNAILMSVSAIYRHEIQQKLAEKTPTTPVFSIKLLISLSNAPMLKDGPAANFMTA